MGRREANIEGKIGLLNHRRLTKKKRRALRIEFQLSIIYSSFINQILAMRKRTKKNRGQRYLNNTLSFIVVSHRTLLGGYISAGPVIGPFHRAAAISSAPIRPPYSASHALVCSSSSSSSIMSCNTRCRTHVERSA